MYARLNPILESVAEVLVERELDEAVGTALTIAESHGYVIDDPNLTLEDLAEAVEALAEADDIPLEEKDLLKKVGNVVRRAAATYGKFKGQYQANKDRWSEFKKSVSNAFSGGKKHGYDTSRSKWDKKVADPRAMRKAQKAAAKAKGAARKGKLKQGEKMVFGKVVNIKDAKRKKEAAS
jgi:hypothetical protein